MAARTTRTAQRSGPSSPPYHQASPQAAGGARPVARVPCSWPSTSHRVMSGSTRKTYGCALGQAAQQFLAAPAAVPDHARLQAPRRLRARAPPHTAASTRFWLRCALPRPPLGPLGRPAPAADVLHVPVPLALPATALGILRRGRAPAAGGRGRWPPAANRAPANWPPAGPCSTGAAAAGPWRGTTRALPPPPSLSPRDAVERSPAPRSPTGGTVPPPRPTRTAARSADGGERGPDRPAALALAVVDGSAAGPPGRAAV